MHKLSVIAQGIQADSRRDLDLLLEEMDVSGVRVQHLHVLKQHENGNCGYHALKNVTLDVQACFTKSMEEAKARLMLTENRPFFWHHFHSNQKLLRKQAQVKERQHGRKKIGCRCRAESLE